MTYSLPDLRLLNRSSELASSMPWLRVTSSILDRCCVMSRTHPTRTIAYAVALMIAGGIGEIDAADLREVSVPLMTQSCSRQACRQSGFRQGPPFKGRDWPCDARNRQGWCSGRRR